MLEKVLGFGFPSEKSIKKGRFSSSEMWLR